MGALVFAQETTTTTGGGGFIAGLLFFYLIVYIFYGYCFGRILKKAGQPLWAGFVPIYNIYLALKIVGRPGWWVILLLIPFVNFVVGIIVYIDLAIEVACDVIEHSQFSISIQQRGGFISFVCLFSV